MSFHTSDTISPRAVWLGRHTTTGVQYDGGGASQNKHSADMRTGNTQICALLLRVEAAAQRKLGVFKWRAFCAPIAAQKATSIKLAHSSSIRPPRDLQRCASSPVDVAGVISERHRMRYQAARMPNRHLNDASTSVSGAWAQWVLSERVPATRTRGRAPGRTRGARWRERHAAALPVHNTGPNMTCPADSARLIASSWLHTTPPQPRDRPAQRASSDHALASPSGTPHASPPGSPAPPPPLCPPPWRA